jgi:peptidoglycan hydrolase CwlO-like protein
MKRSELINLIGIISILLSLYYYFYVIAKDINTKVSDIKNRIEERSLQNDGIAKKLDSISVKKVEIINKIDNRKTTINNLFTDMEDSKPLYDTSLDAAILYLREFSNKQY